MAFNEITRFWPRSDFVALGVGATIDIQLFQQHLASAVLSTPPVAVLHLPGEGIRIDWETLPTEADLLAIDAKVASFAGGATSSAPMSVASAGVTTASNATPVDKLDFTTPPLAAGTYSITYTGQHRLQSAVAGDSAGVKLTLTFSGFPPFFQEDEWPFVLKHGYDYAVTGQVAAGQTVRVQAQVYKLGAGAAVAECSKARFTIDKIG